ncbi:methylitaconate delta2-delta3-isomerase [Advenella kashmirensis WT001]|uniref:Methylitaconate delta2-delta3-isomerase n=1 Tax=Advenella kashmirensis (strain DSM 17095 / LMG 22695 / WT001) TaxID=1036672 RepID=I3UFI0_ADVKW|nr:methylitaconate delta2-delta3-isomerase [Advenella kashmirensis WT001]
MTHASQMKIAATYMRGGTSKGVFFRLNDLPEVAQTPGAARDALLLRVIGSRILMASIPTVWAAPHPAPAR